MARGWESKSVEDQIETAEARKSRANAVRLTEEQIRVLRNEKVSSCRGHESYEILRALRTSGIASS